MSRTAIMVTITLVGFTALAAVLVFVMRAGEPAPEEFDEFDRIEARAEAFGQALADGRLDDAWGLTDPQYRLAVPAERFSSGVEANAYLAEAKSAALSRVKETGATATVEGIWESNAGTLQVVFNLTSKEGEWWITEIVLGGTPSLPRNP